MEAKRPPLSRRMGAESGHLHAQRAAPNHPRQQQWLVSLLVLLSGLLLVQVWDDHSVRQQRDKSMALAADLAADHASRCSADRAGAFCHLRPGGAGAARGRSGAGLRGVATEMLPFYPGIAALGLAPRGTICCVVPLAGNEKAWASTS